MQNHVSPMCKTMHIQHAVVKNQGFARCVFEFEIRPKASIMRANLARNRCPIDTNSRLGKLMQSIRRIINQWVQHELHELEIIIDR